MPEYGYQAKEGPEKMIEGVIEAATENAAIEKISQSGFVPVRIWLHEKGKNTPRTSAAPVPAGALRRQSAAWVYLFSGHLARLVKAGVPILKAIHLLSSHEKDAKVREALQVIEREIREGKTLAGAMEIYPAMFSPMYVSVVRAGEATGSLHQSLLRMSVYYKKQDELVSKVRRAMAYPAVLACAGVASIIFIITFLVPRLEKVFADIGHELPLPTRIVLGFGLFMQHFWYLALLAAALLFVFLPRVLKDRIGKSSWDAMKLKIPFFGKLIVKIEFARFSRTLSLCVSNGLSFLDALRVAIPAAENLSIRSALEDCYQSVEKGSSFGSALKKNAFFSELTSNLISVGEESGRVEETLAEIADVYEQEVDEFLLYSTTFLEPLMILVVGGIIGFIMMAVLLPIFEMNAGF